jgi:hypothetical protein
MEIQLNSYTKKKGIFFWSKQFWKFRENSKELPTIKKLPETNEIIQN